MRKILTLALAGIMVFGVVSFATAGEEIQTQTQTIKPKKISKKKATNIDYTNLIVTENVPGTSQPPKAVRTVVNYAKNFIFNNKHTKFCKVDSATLGSAPTVADAKAVCGKKSAVSKDSGSFASIRVGTSPTTSFEIPVDVVAFNAKGNQLYLYSKPTGDFSGIPATILEGKLKKSKVAGYKMALDVTIPPIDAGAISLFSVQIPKDKVAKKKIKKKNGKKKTVKMSYVQGKCKPKNFAIETTTTFDDGSTTTDDFKAPCKPKK